MNIIKCILLELNQVFFMVFPRFIKEMFPLDQFSLQLALQAIILPSFLYSCFFILTTNEFTINDSFSFVNEIVSIPESDSYVMASFDVKSLFTNIPLDETVAIATESISIVQISTVNSLINSSQNFSLHKDIIFLFIGKIYLQIDGVGMRNPLGPAFANLFLCFHENNWLQNCPL